jgi:hypothetical protein
VFDPENEGSNVMNELSASMPQGSPCTETMKPEGCDADDNVVKEILTKSPTLAEDGLIVKVEISVLGDANTAEEKIDDVDCCAYEETICKLKHKSDGNSVILPTNMLCSLEQFREILRSREHPLIETPTDITLLWFDCSGSVTKTNNSEVFCPMTAG